MSSSKVTIIAEAGVNHNGSLKRAIKMVEAAAAAGADAIKFQSFTAETLVTRTAAKAEYQLDIADKTETQFEMLKKLELSVGDHSSLIHACRSHGIEFLSTPFDLYTIDMLLRMGQKKWKVPSGEMTNLPYLRKIASLGQEIILSSGMSTMNEIRDAIDIFLNGGISLKNITILHCSTQYPTPLEDVNLRAMKTIKSTFQEAEIGYSDHTDGIEVAIAAVGMGAKMIEKHFTLDKALQGPDHMASLDPNEFKTMVKAIRRIETALGSKKKTPNSSESKNAMVVRKSIVASRPIRVGELFTNNNLTTKRPGTGVSPMCWDQIIGKNAKKDYDKDDMIDA